MLDYANHSFSIKLSNTQVSENADATGYAIANLLESLVCPVCSNQKASLIVKADDVRCVDCNNVFPLFKCAEQSIPWLFEHPAVNLQEWKARLNGFLHLNQQAQQRLKEAQKDKRLSKTGQKRINKLLNAKKQQISQILDLLSPLNLEHQNTELLNDPVSALQSKTPKVQGLTSYYDNIFRDWAWDNGENEQMLEAVNSVLSEQQVLGKVLTIGSGAGRLSYDIHQKYSPTYSVLLDINPLLMFAACQAIQEKKFQLTEFPIAPLNKDAFVAEYNCGAPHASDAQITKNENIFYLFGDGMNPPVKEKSFNTVVTPWLLDIIPQNLRDYIPRINSCLEIGGSWVNTGSLAFFHKNQSWCYSEEEVIELIVKNGFEIISTNRSTIQYMRSPLSAHGRTETVFTFCARKIKDVVVPSNFEYLPDWIKVPTRAIPKQNEQEFESSRHLLQAQVFGAIDGKRSVEQIGELVAKLYNLQVNEATHAVRQILIDHYENN